MLKLLFLVKFVAWYVVFYFLLVVWWIKMNINYIIVCYKECCDYQTFYCSRNSFESLIEYWSDTGNRQWLVMRSVKARKSESRLLYKSWPETTTFVSHVALAENRTLYCDSFITNKCRPESSATVKFVSPEV